MIAKIYLISDYQFVQLAGNASTIYTRCLWICHFPVVSVRASFGECAKKKIAENR